MSIKSIPKMNFSPEALEKMGKQKKHCDQFIIYNTYRNQLIESDGDQYMTVAQALDKILGNYHFHNALVEVLKKEKQARGSLTKADVEQISKFAVYEILDALYKAANTECVDRIKEVASSSPLKRLFIGGRRRRTTRSRRLLNRPTIKSQRVLKRTR
jgi:hypothetical protein